MTTFVKTGGDFLISGALSGFSGSLVVQGVLKYNTIN
jgi:hypothetical protein